MRTLFLFVAALFVLFVNAEGAEYRFTLNGKPETPSFVAVHGDGSTARPGDIVEVGSFAFVLDEPGDYQLHRLASDPSRLWRSDSKGAKTLLACRVEETYASEAKKLVDPLAGLNDQQLLQLRGVDLELWPKDTESRLARLDLKRCLIGVSGKLPIDSAQNGPSLPTTVRYLSLQERSSEDALKNLDWLSKYDALECLQYRGSLEAFDAAWLPAGEHLRTLQLLGIQLVHPEALSRSRGLRNLSLAGWSNAKSLSALKGLNALQWLDISSSSIEDLSDVASLPAIERVSADSSPVRRLPQKFVPTLKRLDLLATGAESDQLEAFRKTNPKCELNCAMLEKLQRKLTGATRLRVRTGGLCHRQIDEEKTLFDSKDPAVIREVISMIAVDDSAGAGHCMCCGSPSLEFYQGEELVVTLGMHHGVRMRWSEGWPGDAELIDRSRDALTQWLAKVGAPGPAEELKEHREQQRAARRRHDMLMVLVPRETMDALKQAKSKEEAADAFRKNIKTEGERAQTYLRIFGCDFGNWSHSDQFDQLTADTLLPEISKEVLGKVSLKPGEQATNGLARWLFSERKWSDWKAAELEAVLDVVAREGLTHPRENNRRKTLLALGEMGTPAARELLRDVLRQKVVARTLPDNFKSDVGGMVTFRGEAEEIPEGCSDRVHAAIWLAKLNDAESKEEIANLENSLSGAELSALKKVRRD